MPRDAVCTRGSAIKYAWRQKNATFDWWILAALSLVFSIATAFPMHGSGVLNAAMARQLGIDRRSNAVAFGLMSLSNGSFSPVSAWLTSKIGTGIVISGKLIAGSGCVCLPLKSMMAQASASLRYLVASDSGRIVNVSADAALKSGAGMGAYSASKAGGARLTESLADELKDKGVTVNAVLPSSIDTAQNRGDMPNADFTRWVAPEKIGVVMAFLLSSDADGITGALVPVAGRA